MALVSRVVAICALVLVVSAPSAVAATWRKVTGFGTPDSTILEASVVRAQNGVLNIGWSQGKNVLNTQVSADGKAVSGPHTVFTYEQAAGGVGLVALPGGGLRVFFSGLDAGKPHDTLMSTATSADGISWAVQPTPASDSHPGDNAPVYTAGHIDGTIFANGTPMSVWQDSAGARYHVGTSQQDPDVTFGGFGSGPSTATDSATGAVAVGWNNGDAGRTQAFFLQPAAGFPPGPFINAPGGAAVDHGHPVDVTNRSDGAAGIFMAYLRGNNPFNARPMVWHIGDFQPIQLTGREGRLPGVGMSVDGRIWAFWAEGVYTGQKRKIFVRRSNEKVTKFGEPVFVKPPSGTNDGNVWELDGEGASNGSLDLVALLQRDAAGNELGNYVTRVLPGITLRVKKLDNGGIQFRTLDAGDKLATKIKFAGDTKETGPDGKITFPAPNPGKYTARATKDGYTPTTKRVRVKAP